MTTDSITLNTSIADLCTRSHEVSASKGWLDGEKRPFHLIARLMKSELYEAFEDWRANKGLNETYYEVKYEEGSLIQLEEEKHQPAFRKGSKTMTLQEYRDFLAERPEGVKVLSAKPCGIPIELADFVIRIAQHCGTENIDLEAHVKTWLDETGGLEEHVLDDFSLFLDYVEDAVNAANTFAGTDRDEELGAAFGACFFYAEKSGIELWKAVHEKEAFNRTRPHRHGGKKV